MTEKGDRGMEPPQNQEAEQALLAALLVNNKAFDRVGEFVRPEHFAQAVHGRIFEAISKLIDRGEIASPVTLKNLFDQDGSLQEIGGSAYLFKLAANMITIMNAADYGRTIVDLWKRRQLIAICQEIGDHAGVIDLDLKAEDIIRHAEQALYELGEDTQRGHGPVPAEAGVRRALDQMDEAHKNAGRLLGAPSGFSDLDRLLAGFLPGNLYILAGRTSMGKTAGAVEMCTNAAMDFALEASGAGKPPKHVLEFDLEMSLGQVNQRRLAARTGIALEKIRRGQVDPGEVDRLVGAAADLGKLPILTDDTPRLGLQELRSRARKVARLKGGLGLIKIDHIGFISTPKDLRGNRNAEVSEITASLKAMAKELQVPILALSQLSRELEKREDKRPMLSDLRDSGGVEQDADAVIFVYRKEYYLSREAPEKRLGEKEESYLARRADWDAALAASRGRADLIVAKHRDGAIGTVTVHFDGATMRMGNFSNQEEFAL